MTSQQRRPAPRKNDSLPKPPTPNSVYIISGFAAYGIGTAVYWLYRLVDLVF